MDNLALPCIPVVQSSILAQMSLVLFIPLEGLWFSGQIS
jgi:hypothetical protein